MVVINTYEPSDWLDLQRQVARIFHECGFEAEMDKTLAVARGTVDIDVYALDTSAHGQTHPSREASSDIGYSEEPCMDGLGGCQISSGQLL